MATNVNINAAIVGFGGMGDLHRQMINEGVRIQKKIQNIPGWRVSGSFDIRQERQAFARAHGLHAYASFEELLADPEINMVICATPNDAHKDIVLRSLKAGKNVICEKPVALSVADFDEMVRVSESTGRFFTVGQNRRWDEDYVTAKKIYEERLIGKILRIESRVHGSRGIPQDWRKAPEHGGGMVYDWGIHVIDQAIDMIHEKIKYVYASLDHYTETCVDDGLHVELTFESGLVYFVEIGTSHFIPLPRWYMTGRDGSAVIEDWSLKGKMCRVTDRSFDQSQPVQAGSGITKTMAPRVSNTTVELPLPKVESDISGFYNNITDTLYHGDIRRIQLSEVRKALEVVEAVFESAKKRKVIAFE